MRSIEASSQKAAKKAAIEEPNMRSVCSNEDVLEYKFLSLAPRSAVWNNFF